MTLILRVALAPLAVLTSLGSASASAVSCASPPSPVTGTPSGVSASEATLRGSIDPNGCPTMSSFQYGRTGSYGTATTPKTAGSGTSSKPASSTITGLAATTIYHYRIVAIGAAGTTYGSDVIFQTLANCAPGGPVPSVTNSVATGVTASAATLHANVDPNGCETKYSFEYGRTASYGSATATDIAGSGTISKQVAARITGLAATTIYHFRIVATSAAGTTYGPDVTFQTPANCAPGGPLPSVMNSVATGVTVSAATLHASVDPNGCTTTYQFAYGKTTAYGHRTPSVHAGSGTSPTSASEAIIGLVPNTRYHFRILAYSPSGKAAGPDLTFKTALGSVVRIVHGPASLDRPFVAGILLACVHGRGRCRGAVKIFRAHRVIGQHRFSLRLGKTRVILVGLNGLGRALFRSHQMLRVEVVARLRHYEAGRFLSLVRRFRVATG
jgi:hypothetical protein